MTKGIITLNHTKQGLESLEIGSIIPDHRLESTLRQSRPILTVFKPMQVYNPYNSSLDHTRELLSSDPKPGYTKPIQEKIGKYARPGNLKPWKPEASQTTASLPHLQSLHLVQPLFRVGGLGWVRRGEAERERGEMLATLPYNTHCTSNVSPLYKVVVYRVCIRSLSLLEQTCCHQTASKRFLEGYPYVMLCITGLLSKSPGSDSKRLCVFRDSNYSNQVRNVLICLFVILYISLVIKEV